MELSKNNFSISHSSRNILRNSFPNYDVTPRTKEYLIFGVTRELEEIDEWYIIQFLGKFSAVSNVMRRRTQFVTLPDNSILTFAILKNISKSLKPPINVPAISRYFRDFPENKEEKCRKYSDIFRSLEKWYRPVVRYYRLRTQL